MSIAIDNCQLFWDAYREHWRDVLRNWIPNRGTRAWTQEKIAAALESTKEFVGTLGLSCVVGKELPVTWRNTNGVAFGRLDVYARELSTNVLTVAYESELAHWGYNGESKKDWRQEFIKLCGIDARLRVLSSTFPAGTGGAFREDLKGHLQTMKSYFDSGFSGEFCLVFGPEDTRKDPDQPWLAFALERDFVLRELRSANPLRPRWIIEKRS